MYCEEKNEVAAILNQKDNINLPLRRIGSNHTEYTAEITFSNVHELNIMQLIGERSHYLFQIMKIRTNFLHCDAESWPTNNEYLNARYMISKTLVCVNDNSERVFSASKHRISRQRCRNENSFRRSMLATSYKK